jgi:hypothetical protein
MVSSSGICRRKKGPQRKSDGVNLVHMRLSEFMKSVECLTLGRAGVGNFEVNDCLLLSAPQ